MSSYRVVRECVNMDECDMVVGTMNVFVIPNERTHRMFACIYTKQDIVAIFHHFVIVHLIRSSTWIHLNSLLFTGCTEMNIYKKIYRNYFIKRAGAYFKFKVCKGGAYWKGALIGRRALIRIITVRIKPSEWGFYEGTTSWEISLSRM